MKRRSVLSRIVSVVVVASLTHPQVAVGQSAPPALAPATAELAQPSEGMVPTRFAVAGPLTPADTLLTLLVVQRSCGVDEYEPEAAIALVSGTEAEVWARVDVAVGPDGRPCDSETLLRVPVTLTQPLGERSINDAGSDSGTPPFVNGFDAIDAGLRYSCLGSVGDGWSVTEMLGPGLEAADDLPVVGGARLVRDDGDRMEWLGRPHPRGGFDHVIRWYRRGVWHTDRDRCLPRAVLFPGIDAATWKLRGRRPRPRDRRVRIWVQEEVCNGRRPISARIVTPIVQVYRDAIVVIMATTVHETSGRAEQPVVADGYAPVDCIGNAPVPYAIDLPITIGKRKLLDGAVFPPAEKPVRRR